LGGGVATQQWIVNAYLLGSGIGSAINNATSRVAGLIAISFISVIVGDELDYAGSIGSSSLSPSCSFSLRWCR
jgi:hypothetical protein